MRLVLQQGNAMKYAALTMISVAVALGGCATKRYGRLQPLTAAETQVYDCRDIEVEIAKVEAFRQQVSDGARINGASVMGFLGDWGIGNANEKNSAERTATQRMQDLLALRAQRQCGVRLSQRRRDVPVPADEQPTPAAAQQSSEPAKRHPDSSFGSSRVHCVTC